MNNFRLLNTLFGWVSFFFALAVYSLTLEPTGSLWDCGEFISAAYRLQVVHPPGAPLFLLIGRFFSLFAGADVMNVAISVNMVSATTSALCVMFTFWITTYFAKRIAEKLGDADSVASSIAIIGSGLVAAGTLTFSDTFWFSAVEAEVYAASSFFMSFTFWCILKWERVSDQPFANRWLVFIGYVVGLAIGVHLLNLLVIPGIVLVYYFKKFPFKRSTLLYALAIGFALLFFVQIGVIPGIPTLAAKFDMFFVNSMGMGFGSGVMFFAALLLGGLITGLIYTQKNGLVHWNTGLLAFAFILVGYSSYAMVLIRSQANTPIDMNNPEDPLNLVYYLNREQYGDRPLLKGPHYKTPVTKVEKGEDNYIKGDEKYEVAGYDVDVEYDPKQQMMFPRIYDGNDPSHVQGYKDWTGIPDERTPKFSDNLRFFFRYQLGTMYWRYFMWNFAGRQNDDQKMQSTDVLAGNWISGIAPLDAMRLGPQKNLPDDFKNNPSRNTYYLLPFILGLAGLGLQIRKEKGGALINGILFLTTGIMLIIYLNPPPYEPRERDYVFVGSFQVFSMWVGLGVLGLYYAFRKYISGTGSAAFAVTIGILAAPALMGTQNWNDHDRSGRYMSTDFARNYLKSCAPNAILFTNGDNDTYPLWYVQNVEGYRTDVRVINLSLLNASDYVESLRDQQYESQPIKLSFTSRQLWPGTRDRVDYIEKNPVASPDQHYLLSEILKFVANEDDPRAKATSSSGEQVAFLPSKKFRIPVNREEILRTGTVQPRDSMYIVPEIRFELPGKALSRSSLVLLDVISNNLWERPIYFTTTTGSETYVGLQEYFQIDGLTYRLVPIKSQIGEEAQRNREYGFLDTEKMYAQLVDSFTWGGMENGNMWVDDKMKLVPRVIRSLYIRTARQLMGEQKNEKAVKLLEICEQRIPDSSLPYENFMVEMAELYYMAGANANAQKLLANIGEKMHQRARYLKQFNQRKYPKAYQEYQYALQMLQIMQRIAESGKDTVTAKDLETKLKEVSI